MEADAQGALRKLAPLLVCALVYERCKRAVRDAQAIHDDGLALDVYGGTDRRGDSQGDYLGGFHARIVDRGCDSLCVTVSALPRKSAA